MSSMTLEQLEKVKEALERSFELASSKVHLAQFTFKTRELDNSDHITVAKTGLALLEANRQIRAMEQEQKTKPKLQTPAG